MMTHRRTWQKREGQVAAMFGSKRKPGSGSGGRDDETSSDSVHPRLYIETKTKAKHTAVTLWDDTAAKAKKEGKVPVVCLCEKGRPGFWIMVRSTDLAAVLAEVGGSGLQDRRAQIETT